MNIFKNREVKLAERKAGLEAELAVIKGDQDYQRYIRGEDLKKRAEDLRGKLIANAHDLELVAAQARPAVDQRIVQAVAWCRAERERTARELSTRGITERTMFGSFKGYLETNEPKIIARIAALDAAAKEIEALDGAADLDAEISLIRSSVPFLDTVTERVPVSPGIAAALGE